MLFLNPKSGSGKAGRAGLAERAGERGIDVVVLHADDDLGTLVAGCRARRRRARRRRRGRIAGRRRDGRTRPRASLRLRSAGTRNHFAFDLGVDRRDLVGSLDAFTEGVERRIDVAEVNGRLFLNNVSLGIYGDAVRQASPTYRDAKARTLLETAAHVLGPSAAAVDLELVDDQGRPHLEPAVVLVSNNPYSLEPPHAPGTRPTLDSGQLGVIVLDTPRLGRGAGRTWTAARLQVQRRRRSARRSGRRGGRPDPTTRLRRPTRRVRVRGRLVRTGSRKRQPPGLPAGVGAHTQRPSGHVELLLRLSHVLVDTCVELGLALLAHYPPCFARCGVCGLYVTSSSAMTSPASPTGGSPRRPTHTSRRR